MSRAKLDKLDKLTGTLLDDIVAMVLENCPTDKAMLINQKLLEYGKASRNWGMALEERWPSEKTNS